MGTKQHSAVLSLTDLPTLMSAACYMHRLTHAEVARILGVSVSTAMRLYQAGSSLSRKGQALSRFTERFPAVTEERSSKWLEVLSSDLSHAAKQNELLLILIDARLNHLVPLHLYPEAAQRPGVLQAASKPSGAIALPVTQLERHLIDNVCLSMGVTKVDLLRRIVSGLALEYPAATVATLEEIEVQHTGVVPEPSELQVAATVSFLKESSEPTLTLNVAPKVLTPDLWGDSSIANLSDVAIHSYSDLEDTEDGN